MTQPSQDPAQVRANEHGKLRIFALSDDLAAQIETLGTMDPLFAALGVDRLNAADIQVVPVADLDEIGLTGLLTAGYGIGPAEYADHAEMLNALSGHLALLRSGAFMGQEVRLPADGPARLIACFDEPGAGTPPMTPLRSDSAKGTTGDVGTGRARPSDAAMSGRIAMAVLLFLAVFVTLLVWMSG